eukprot:gnl/MRDRNA2_/MRDRNA2_309695_c0_seq1.p1 gnl/MRDRNA2_/MRDRNA2_309695_c0~~gnl/MRDRNA2_/MRDRNA2_309695_c0_seq1.p1  ORF type:complete len:214 (+),score=39.84 gnl/MRDRNA2_/MRDRNA2_309695_c0_seq1:23-643(+)
MAYWSWINRFPPLDVLTASAAEQASIMAKAGADLIMLEMMLDIDRMLALLQGAKQSGLPVWVGLSMGTKEDRKFLNKGPLSTAQPTLANGELLSDAIDAVEAAGGVDVINIMHTEVDDIEACLKVVRKCWSGIYGVYAHSSDWKLNESTGEADWIYDDVVSPNDYATAAECWINTGAQLIGGCCGTGPHHITALQRYCATCKNVSP